MADVASPPKVMPAPYVVMPFENRSGILGMEWMRLAVPFVLGEKAEGVKSLRPVYDELVVTRAPRDKEQVTPVMVAEFAALKKAQWVFSGWVRRPDWKLELGIALWRVSGGKATQIGEVKGIGDFTDVHQLVSTAIVDLVAKAGLASPADDASLIQHESTTDNYAFTLFGRGLGQILKAQTKPDWDKARKTLERTTHIDPRLSEAQRILAILYRRSGKTVLAKVRLEFALRGRPKYAPAMSSLARAARARGQDALAREMFEEALTLRAWDLDTRYRLGALYWELGLIDDAYAQLSMVSDLDPTHLEAKRALVLIYASRSDTAGLIDELRRVVKLAPRDVTTRLDLAAALVSADRTEDAILSYKGILSIEDNNIHALKFIGDLYRKQGHTRRAIRYYGLAMAAAPNDPRAYFLLGSSYVQVGDDAAARRIFLKAQRFGRFRAEAYNHLGVIAYRENNLDQSRWYLRRAVNQKPKKASYRYNLALTLSASNKTADAAVEIRAGLALAPKHTELNYLRGVVLLRSGDAEAARLAFHSTLELDAGHQDAKHNLELLDEMKRQVIQGEVVVEGKQSPLTP